MFVCECVYKNCSTTWESNNDYIEPISGPEYTVNVTDDIVGVMSCNNNSDTFSWNVTVLQPSKYIKH